MTRMFLAMLAVLAVACDAKAGWRCNRGYGHTLYASSAPWGHACWGCHKKKSESQDWRSAIAAVASRQQDNLSFEASLAQILQVQQTQQPQYAPQGYSQTVQGFYTNSPYGYQGSTQFGASSYVQPAWASTATLYDQNRLLAQQLNQGALAVTQQHGNLVAQEAAIQANATNFQTLAAALTTAAVGPAQQQTLQYQVTTTPQGQPVVQELPPASTIALDSLKPLMQAKCIACHSGEAPAGKLDMTKQLSKVQLGLMNKAVDEGTMPKKPDGSAGEKLPLEERALFSNAWLSAQ